MSRKPPPDPRPQANAPEPQAAGLPSATRIAAAGLLVVGILAAYHNCFAVPFVYDDLYAITENPTIRHFWPPWALLTWPAGDTTVGARPLANLTLGINYAVSGVEPWSYHALNVVIHILASLVLFGVVRRTLLLPALRARFAAASATLAFFAALLWSVHPLQTESVTYVVQRVESLMGLFLLGTLYCFIRSLESSRPLAWRTGAFLLCLAGVATKEVMATAPALLLLYDRAYVSGSIREALRRRWRFYAALALTWIPLLALITANGWNRRGSAGFTAGVPAPLYWMTQFEALVRYLSLSVWPHPLVFEYGPFRVPTAAAVAPFATVALPLIAAAVYLAVRRPAAGFLGAWILVILSPSSVVPVATQTMAEHRMYLPLAAVATAAVLGAYLALGRRAWYPLGFAGALLCALTIHRNDAFQSPLTLWADTVSKRPGNFNARNNYGLALFRSGQTGKAIEQYEAALAIEPNYPGVHSNLGNALHKLGRTDDAMAHYRTAIALEPGYAAAHFNLAGALEGEGRLDEAISEYRETLRLSPGLVQAHDALGEVLLRSGKPQPALDEFRASLRVDPEDGRARAGVGEALSSGANPQDALDAYEEAIRHDPGQVEARDGLGLLLCRLGRVPEGIDQFEAALRTRPDFAKARFDLGNALMQEGRVPEAAASYEEALRIDPGMAEASNNLGIILCRSGKLAEGIERIRAAIRAEPGFAQAHFALGTALLQSGDRDGAVAEYRRVLELHPGDPSALKMMQMVGASP